MKILCLYSNACAFDLWDWLEDLGHEVVRYKGRLTDEWLKTEAFDLAVSYTYPYMIRQWAIDLLKGNIVNLHTSYLPYNRGSYPNIWSILEHTPRGVTLHYVDAGLDSGDIISQVLVPLEKNATLKSSYNQLDHAAKQLFKDAFEYYGHWGSLRKKACGKGTFHRDKDFLAMKETDSDWDWNMSIEKFISDVNQQNWREGFDSKS